MFHSWFMDLDNPFEAIVNYLLIEGMDGLGHQDEIPMVRALMCMVTHWTGPTVHHNIRLLGSHDFTKLNYYIVF